MIKILSLIFLTCISTILFCLLFFTGNKNITASPTKVISPEILYFEKVEVEKYVDGNVSCYVMKNSNKYIMLFSCANNK